MSRLSSSVIELFRVIVDLLYPYFYSYPYSYADIIVPTCYDPGGKGYIG